MPESHMDEMVYLYCDQLKGSLEMEFIAGMRALSKQFEGSHIPICAACAGTDLQAKVKKSYTRVLKHKYDVDLKWITEIVSEKEAEKRKFIVEQHDPKFLISDNKYLADQSSVIMAAALFHLIASADCGSILLTRVVNRFFQLW